MDNIKNDFYYLSIIYSTVKNDIPELYTLLNK